MRAPIYALTAAAAFMTSVAIAQPSPQTAPGQPMPGPMMGQGMGPGMMMGRGMMPMTGMMDPTEHIEGRLAFLKTELKITDAQAPQWNAFADAMRANAKRMSDLRGTMMSGGMMGQGAMSGQGGTGLNLPERLDRAEQHMAAHLEMLRSMKGPATQLYAALSDEQKRVADQLIHGPMGMMGMM